MHQVTRCTKTHKGHKENWQTHQNLTPKLKNHWPGLVLLKFSMRPSNPSSHFGFVIQVCLPKSTLEIFFLAFYHILLDKQQK